MAAYMEFSFTGEAARDRYYGDHSSHTLITGGAGSGIPRALNITPSSATTPSGTKRSFAVGMWAVAPQERVRCCSGDAVDLVDKVGPSVKQSKTPANDNSAPPVSGEFTRRRVRSALRRQPTICPLISDTGAMRRHARSLAFYAD